MNCLTQRAYRNGFIATLGLLCWWLLAGPVKASDTRHFLLLGEVHDNPEGHARRLDDLRKYLDRGMRPAIAMEQFDADRQTTLDIAMTHCPTATCVAQMAGDAQWDWAFYEPVIDLARQYQLPLLGANLSREGAMRVAKQDQWSPSLGADVITNYGLDQSLPEAVIQGQQVAIEEGHCGTLPASLVPKMVKAQVARDAQMAWVMAQASFQTRDVVLLAGNGHVRKDIGVPVWLSKTPNVTVEAVAYVERDTHNRADSDDVVRHVDRIVFIPAYPRPDPCESLRKKP